MRFFAGRQIAHPEVVIFDVSGALAVGRNDTASIIRIAVLSVRRRDRDAEFGGIGVNFTRAVRRID
ncbi:MAG: hypothetical protein WKF71_21235 [Pyrinomonadaceae bacterium]